MVEAVPALRIGGVRYDVPPTFDEFSEYETYDFPDWDGYGAASITREAVQTARAFQRLLPMNAPRPDIAPGSDGTIGFEWRWGSSTKRTMILVDAGPDNMVTARRVHESGQITTYEPTHPETGGRALVAQLFS